MSNTKQISFTVNAIAQGRAGDPWRGEVPNSHSGRRETIASSFELAQHIQNDIDGMARTADTAWTRSLNGLRENHSRHAP